MRLRQHHLGVADPSGVRFPDPYQVREDRRVDTVINWVIANWPYLLGGTVVVGGAAYWAYRSKTKG